MPSSARRLVALVRCLTIVGLSVLAYAAHAEPTQAEMQAMKASYERPKVVPFPKSNPFSPAKLALGQQLFYDTRLSGNGTMSCASCHNQPHAWGDGMPTGIGSKGNRLGRRSPTILNLAWAELLFWDGRADTLEDQALGPIQNPDEMNQTLPVLVAELNKVPAYKKAFAAAFPGEAIAPDTVAKAIATFERTVVSGAAPFDRWIEGDEAAIDASAKRGFVVFNTTGHCAACHSGWRFTDDSFQDIGMRSSDKGRGAVIEGVAQLSFAFKTPGLRNVAERAPYMHDGSIATLEDVVAHYVDGFIRRASLSPEIHTLSLTEKDRADLVAFLKTLSSPDSKATGPNLTTGDKKS